MTVHELITKLNMFQDKNMEVMRANSEWGMEHIDHTDILIVKYKGKDVVEI